MENTSHFHERTLLPSPLSCRQKIFIKNLTVNTFVGVHEHEYIKSQPLIISVELGIDRNIPGGEKAFLPRNAIKETTDTSAKIICYAVLSEAIIKLVQNDHIGFVETLAEQIINLCFGDKRVIDVHLRIEKPDAVADATSVGIDIFTTRR